MAGTLNKVMLIGHLGDEVKMHHFDGGGSIARISLATNESYTNKNSGEKINSKPIIHRLSHQKINITFWKLNVLELNDYGIKVKNLKNFPVPIILEKFFNSKANFES